MIVFLSHLIEQTHQLKLCAFYFPKENTDIPTSMFGDFSKREDMPETQISSFNCKQRFLITYAAHNNFLKQIS